MDNLTPITREEMLLNDEPLTPITREEKILAGEDLAPVTRREYFLKKYRHAGSDVMVEELSVTANGTYTAPEGKAYSPVEVAVPMPENAYLLKEASGSLVSFNDGADLPMPSFICDIDAVQDLHGYDAPWVGGAGKNKLPLVLADIKADNTEGTWNGNTYIYNGVTIEVLQDINGNVNGFKFNGTASGDIRFSITRRNIENFPTGDYIYNIQNTIDIANLWVSIYQPQSKAISVKDSTNVNVSITSGQAFGGGYIFSNAGNVFNNVLIQPMLRLATETDPTFAPYSNICPISGHTGLDAWVRGKNRLPMTVDGIKTANTDTTWSGNACVKNGITYTILTDSNNNVIGIKANGTASANAMLDLNPTGSLTIPANTTFSLSGCPEGGGGSTYRLYPKGGTSATYDNGSGKLITLDSAITNPFRINIYSGVQVDNIIFYPMIVYTNAIDMDFEPYNPQSQTIQVSWQIEAGEVFGGYVDLVSGVLTVTHKVSIYDGSENWILHNSNRFYLDSLPTELNTAEKKTSISNKGIYRDTAWGATGSYFAFGGSGIYINKTNAEQTLEDFKQSLGTTNYQVKYPLATPITYQLTPTQIKSLLGTNNAWCSTGDVNVKYNKDATTVINSLIARIEALENA